MLMQFLKSTVLLVQEIWTFRTDILHVMEQSTEKLMDGFWWIRLTVGFPSLQNISGYMQAQSSCVITNKEAPRNLV